MIVDITKDVRLTIYKSFITTLGDYLYKLPMSTMNVRFQKLLAKGKNCIPKNKHAQDILIAILSGCQAENPNSSAILQHLFNDRFSDLQPPLRPDYLKEEHVSFHNVAFWTVNDVVSDKIGSLINLEDHSKEGDWTNDKGEKVDLKVTLQK